MKKGFTIIELLVVVSIIAVLTAVVLTQFSTVRARSRDAKRISDIAQMQLAIQQYFDRCNQYPSATGTGPNATLNLASNVGCPFDTSGNRITLGSFMNQLPTAPAGIDDPTGVQPYSYRYIVHNNGTVNDDYYLIARLEQPNRALDDDIDGVVNPTTGALTRQDVPDNTAGWSGWAAFNNSFQRIYVGESPSTSIYIYAVRSR